MLSIIISPNRLPPPRITIPTTNTHSNTSEKKKKKKFSRNSEEEESVWFGPGRKRWTIAVQEFRYRLGQARDHRFFAWIPRSALKHWHSAAEGNVSLGCNACLLLLSRHGRVHGVRASSRLSYSFFFFSFPFFFLSFLLLFISPPISLLLLLLSFSLLPRAWPRIERVYIYTYPSVSPRGTFRTRHTVGSVNLPMARQSSSSAASSLREWCTDYMAEARRLNASNRPFLRDTNSIRGGADRVSVVKKKNETQRGRGGRFTPSCRHTD